MVVWFFYAPLMVITIAQVELAETRTEELLWLGLWAWQFVQKFLDMIVSERAT